MTLHPTSSLVFLATLLAAQHLAAQDLLHYKFDEHCGSEVIAFAPGSTANAALVTTLAGGTAAARTNGRFGEALAGTLFPATATTRVTTGWAPNTPTGDFSFAMWLRNHAGNPAALPFGYLFGAQGGNFRLFTGSSGFLFLSGFPGSATSATNLTPALNAGWVHVACTVSSSALQATWYVNGAPDGVTTLTQPVALAGSNFAVGARDIAGSNPCPLDIDEFVLSSAVWTAAEVQALATAPRAADGDYASGITSQCGAGNIVLASTGGPPAIGNPNYALTVATNSASLFVLLAGFDRCSFGGALPLPLDGTPLLPLLNGCQILADAPITISGTTSPAPAQLPLPIPASAPTALTIYTQALGLDLATLATSMSSGFATSTGL